MGIQLLSWMGKHMRNGRVGYFLTIGSHCLNDGFCAFLDTRSESVDFDSVGEAHGGTLCDVAAQHIAMQLGVG